MPVSLELFKRVIGSFPTGVTIVTALAADGLPRGMTSNAVCSVSAEPPQLLVCVDRRSQTLAAIRASGGFVVNILTAGREELSERFASKLADKFAGTTWEPSAVAGGAPILVGDVVAVAECLLVDEVEAGDHVILVGGIEEGSASDLVPMMYHRRTYAAWPKPVREPATVGADVADAIAPADWAFNWDFH